MAAFFFTAVLAYTAAGCGLQRTASSRPAAPVLTRGHSHAVGTLGWNFTQLYFGLGPADHPQEGISEARWRRFLDTEVTPRFPAGLSVMDVYGQWQGKHEKSPERLRSKLLIIDYPDTQENRIKIDEIRSAWKRMTGDQSVLEVTIPARVSF